MHRTGRVAALIVVVALVVSFAFFIWPTPYRPLDIDADVLAARVHRVTGEVDVLMLEGWVPLRPAPAEASLATGADSGTVLDSLWDAAPAAPR